MRSERVCTISRSVWCFHTYCMCKVRLGIGGERRHLQLVRDTGKWYMIPTFKVFFILMGFFRE